VRIVTIDEGAEGQRLDNFLIRVLKGVPKTHVYRIIRAGEVRVNGKRSQADTRLAVGDAVRVPPVRVAQPSGSSADAATAGGRIPAGTNSSAPARDFPVLFEDDHLVAIAKPAGVAVHGGSGVSFGVIEQMRRARPQARFLELVHRLDRETSGILLIAKKRSALLALQDQFRERQTGKTYAALVIGDWPADHHLIDVALHKYLTADGERRVRAVTADAAEGQRSITWVKVLRRFAGYSLLDVTIRTGRTHQIRVHLAHAGHPIVGDDKYGDFALNKAWAAGRATPGGQTAAAAASQSGTGHRFDRMFLHARRLAFDHPASGERIELSAPLPAECETLMRFL
jgi:23S rRNA pseudouridine955/2504/2580 synthase